MRKQSKLQWKYHKLRRRIPDLVGIDLYALWSINSDPAIGQLKEQMEVKARRQYNDKEFIALVRGKLHQLFGKPTRRAVSCECSFIYDLQASYRGKKVYFQFCDRQTRDLCIFWEFSTSEQDVRNSVKNDFLDLLLQTVPADFTDEFSCENDISVAYGCHQQKPWADVEVSFKLERRLFQSSMKNLQQKRYRMLHSSGKDLPETHKMGLPIFQVVKD